MNDSQREKRQVMRDTYLSRQANTVDDAGGRYAKIRPSNVTGSAPSQQIPKQPASSPWAQGFDQLVGVEPELGQDVNAMEPVGSAHEIQSSLDAAERGQMPAIPSSVETPAASSGERSVDGLAGRSPTRRI